MASIRKRYLNAAFIAWTSSNAVDHWRTEDCGGYAMLFPRGDDGVVNIPVIRSHRQVEDLLNVLHVIIDLGGLISEISGHVIDYTRARDVDEAAFLAPPHTSDDGFRTVQMIRRGEI